MKTFLYLHCCDLDAMRACYGDAIGLDEIFHSEADRLVGYRVGSLQLSVQESADAGVVDGWADQLGWDGGGGTVPSWGVELSAERFATAVERVRAAGVATFSDAPVWVGYWSFALRDPMGNTVEISATDRAAWG